MPSTHPMGVQRMARPRPSISKPIRLLAGLLLAGCTGYAGPLPAGGSPDIPGAGPPVVKPPAPDAPITGPLISNPRESNRLVRLSHKQWSNNHGDLLRLGTPSNLAISFIHESVRTRIQNKGNA